MNRNTVGEISMCLVIVSAILCVVENFLILLYRYGLAAYHITSEDGTTAVAGTLVVSNEQADR